MSSVHQNCSQTSGECTRAKTSDAVSVCPFNLNRTIDTQVIICSSLFQDHSITHFTEIMSYEIAGHSYRGSALITVCSLSVMVLPWAHYENGGI